MTASYLYQAVLRRELTERVGIAWLPVQRGAADVQGVPRDVIEHFSQRRAEIVQHMAEHGGRSAAAAQVAALETRSAKQGVPVDRLRGLWRSRAAEHGLDHDRVLTLFGRVVPAVHPLVGVDVEQLTADASTFGRPELLQAWLPRSRLARGSPNSKVSPTRRCSTRMSCGSPRDTHRLGCASSGSPLATCWLRSAR